MMCHAGAWRKLWGAGQARTAGEPVPRDLPERGFPHDSWHPAPHHRQPRSSQPTSWHRGPPSPRTSPPAAALADGGGLLARVWSFLTGLVPAGIPPSTTAAASTRTAGRPASPASGGPGRARPGRFPLPGLMFSRACFHFHIRYFLIAARRGRLTGSGGPDGPNTTGRVALLLEKNRPRAEELIERYGCLWTVDLLREAALIALFHRWSRVRDREQ